MTLKTDFPNLMTLGKKLVFGFGAIVVALVVVVAMSFTGVSGIVGYAEEFIYGNSLNSLFSQKELDHIEWAFC